MALPLPLILRLTIASATMILLCQRVDAQESRAQSQPAARIEFLENLEAAQLTAQRARKPIIIDFTAAWCGWCRRMESETFRNAGVQAEASKVIWLKIDVDEQPDIAAAYGVRGLPHTAIIDAQGEVLESSVGFMPAKEFLAFLQKGVDTFQAKNVADDGAAPDLDKVVTSLVESLARAQRAGRDSAMASIDKLGNEAWPILQRLLNDERLSVRAAAYHALVEATGASLPFDPFAETAQRAEQAAAWEKWIEAHPLRPAKQPRSGHEV